MMLSIAQVATIRRAFEANPAVTKADVAKLIAEAERSDKSPASRAKVAQLKAEIEQLWAELEHRRVQSLHANRDKRDAQAKKYASMRSLLAEAGKEIMSASEFTQDDLAFWSRQADRDPEWFDKLWHAANCRVSRVLADQGPRAADEFKERFLPAIERLRLAVEIYRAKVRKTAGDQLLSGLVRDLAAMTRSRIDN
jgi:hypothetical protein